MTAQLRSGAVLALFVLGFGGIAHAADVAAADAAMDVELFAAIEAGEIEAKIIPKDATEATILLENKTDKPLRVKLPEAFAAAPVMAQIGGGLGGGGLGGGGGGGAQGIGGGMGGIGGGGGGGGFFAIEPGKIGKAKVPCVCLEHGKPDPRPAIEYRLMPIGEFTNEPGVAELCAALGRGQIDQRAAQAAAWHLNNHMSWQELAAKVIKRANGARYPYFHQAELIRAVAAANTAVAQARENSGNQPSPGEQGS